jgi:hypothetical protein
MIWIERYRWAEFIRVYEFGNSSWEFSSCSSGSSSSSSSNKNNSQTTRIFVSVDKLLKVPLPNYRGLSRKRPSDFESHKKFDKVPTILYCTRVPPCNPSHEWAKNVFFPSQLQFLGSFTNHWSNPDKQILESTNFKSHNSPRDQTRYVRI